MKKKRLAIWTLCVAVCLLMSGNAFGQGKGHGAGGGGKPASTGLQHAESKANVHGQQGIENAEGKQAAHKDTDPDKNTGKKKGKHKGKAKGKKPASTTTAIDKK